MKIEEISIKNTYSPHINEVIEKKPNWLIRYGIGAMLFFLVLFLIAAWMVRYPDVIIGKVNITTPKPPIDLAARVNAPIAKKYAFSENDTVLKGDAILLLESTVSNNQVLLLYKHIDTDLGSRLTKNAEIWLDSLGSLQPFYNAFALAMLNLENYELDKPHEQRILALNNILSGNTKGLKFSNNYLKSSQKDYDSKKIEFKRYEALYKKGVISASEFEQTTQTLLQKEMGFANDNKNLNMARMSIANIQREIMELELQKTEYEQQLQATYIRAKNEIKTQLEQWEYQYIIRSPINGRLSFFNEMNEGDFVTAGERILTIIPFQKQEIYALGMFPVENSGKVKVGNKVVLKLDAYPYHEYGTIEGNIKRISEIPVENAYSIVINLPNGLQTNYEKKILFKQRLSATADIVTKEQSVLQRIFYQFENIFKN
ncbi:HlyD family secretion protein [Maribacter sp. IgM3_T14_3]|uniref:HlyD family secretion protein n=1 Tax=Maribacter sp. IgM3_T14_3 TaxID=3415140 RepID=UPI003C6F9844